jgi:Carboxypeptidase regulatory-like domain
MFHREFFSLNSFLSRADSLPGCERSKWRVDLPANNQRAAANHHSPEISRRLVIRTCGKAARSSACLFLAASLLALLSRAQQPDQPANPYGSARVTVQGVVRNSATGEPLPRALVQIEGDADTGTLTNGEGRFEIPGVPAGPQIVRVVKPGFRDRPYAAEEAGLQAEGPAHSLLVAAQMPDLNFTLAPDCAIQGHIELSTGDPADGISVTLLKNVVRFGRTVWAQVTSTKTNGEGNYRFGGLPDGVYAVSTEPALESEPAVSVVAAGSAANVARSGYASVFYPDARDLAGATRIRLSGGAQAEANFSLALEPFYPVTAIDAAQTNTPGATRASQTGNYLATVMDASGHLLPYPAQYDDATHSLQASLPDGTYILVVRRFGFPEDSAVRFGRPVHSVGALAGAVEFTVAGHPVTGRRFPLGAPPAGVVHLRLIHNTDNPAAAFTANNGPDLVNLSLDPINGAPLNTGENVWSMDNGPDAITFTAQPGSYWLTAYVQRKGLCAGAFSAGSFNLAREPLALSLASSPPPMELELRDDCGTLSLNLPATLSVFAPGEESYYTVYVVPDFDTVQSIPPMTMHPSSGPTLNLDGLTPGSYHVYIFDSPVHLEYRNPAVLAALPNPGQQVTVSAGTTASLTLEAPEH